MTKASVAILVALSAILTCALRADAADITGMGPFDAQTELVRLRNFGPKGLESLLQQYDKSRDPKLIPMIDAVAAQHDDVWSRLYWYTDLSKAEAAAKEQHKPILYLRLLGKLSDEYSCANSRFFRTILYANSTVSKMLREQFILVWCSERPVPTVTIDFGDGRVLKRTITGNSIHYVLDSDGNVIDALPGIYAPRKFADLLSRARWQVLTGDESTHKGYWVQSQNALLVEWNSSSSSSSSQTNNGEAERFGPPNAVEAGRVAISKGAVEQPMLAMLSPDFANQIQASIDNADSVAWQQMAMQYQQQSMLDAHSIALIRSQNPAKYADSAVLQKTVDQFQSLIAQDTVQNNYKLRRQILDWLMAGKGQVALDDLNRRVYSELFLTPRSDQWLGMLPESQYTALDGDGVCPLPQ